MPTYEYACDACGHQFETFQSMKDDPLTVCPKCEKTALRRLIFGGTGVIFKGSGFYVTDSKKNGKRASGGGAGDTSRSDSSETESVSAKDGGTAKEAAPATQTGETGKTGTKETGGATKASGAKKPVGAASGS